MSACGVGGFVVFLLLPEWFVMLSDAEFGDGQREI